MMNVEYACIMTKSDQLLLAQSTSFPSQEKRINKLLPTIMKGDITNVMEIENDRDVVYVKTKKLIFICVSHKLIPEKTKMFMEQFISSTIKEFSGLDNILNMPSSNRLCLQNRLGTKINDLIFEANNGVYKNKTKSMIYEMNSGMLEIKKELQTNIKRMTQNEVNLKELLLSSKKIQEDAEEHKQLAEEVVIATKNLDPIPLCTKSIRNCVIYIFISAVILFAVYTIFAIYRCGNMNLFCDKED
jgi:hypothetical protein